MGTHDVDELDTNFVKAPNSTLGKIRIEPFDESEIYKGIGAGFVQWGQHLMVTIDLDERACGFRCQEDTSQLVEDDTDAWFVMDMMVDSYRIVFSKQQAIKLFAERKEKVRSWNDRLLYLLAFQKATKSDKELILENIVKYAQPEPQALIISRYNRFRTDYLSHAEEIVYFIQGLEDETVGYEKNGNAVVNLVTDTRRYHTCSQVRHIARYCRDKTNTTESGRKKSYVIGKNNKWAFAATASDNFDFEDWILDTGASCHLVRDVSMLFKAENCASSEVFRQPDGTPLQETKRGKAGMHTSVDGVNTEIELSSAYSSP
uniref:Mitochondrial Carrier (MC) Family putative n=1 Tax=Albugo laibachii Nc14 TaxID=890382 RepID=F0W9U1_9STRA|nr:Mitochondrial Carrier (MC) Family putative [Albugo laibachii Nc14]|eukprot:CCA17909.1 Mitochondrial Carrier (MC) Family putative [Albugo laibachii Nc14]